MRLNIFSFKKKYLLEEAEAHVKKIVMAVLKKEHKTFKNMNIVIADDRFMIRLNKVFFKKKKPTNVISFKMEDDCEIYIARERIKKELDLYYYVVHGLLHVVGYDHQTRYDESRMDKKCWEYLSIKDFGR